MTKLAVEKDIVIKRLEGIETDLVELENLASLDFKTFSTGNGWKLAQFHLHRALEGVFNISTHIISRIPGNHATQYKEVALKMGEIGIVPEEFAKEEFVKMAKYRNRLVHFYAQISKEELHRLLQNNLNDFNIFLAAIKELLANPHAHNLILD